MVRMACRVQGASIGPMEGRPSNTVLRYESLAMAVIEIENLVRKA